MKCFVAEIITFFKKKNDWKWWLLCYVKQAWLRETNTLYVLSYAVFVHWKYEEDHELEGKRFEARGKGEGKGIYDMKPEEGIVWRKKRN